MVAIIGRILSDERHLNGGTGTTVIFNTVKCSFTLQAYIWQEEVVRILEQYFSGHIHSIRRT